MRPVARWKAWRASTRRSRLLRYVLAFAAGAALTGAVTFAVATPGLWHTSDSQGTPIYSVRPTGVGLPRVGASGTVGAGEYADALKAYHDSGRYEDDLELVDARARVYLDNNVRALRRAAARCGCHKPKPSMVLDIDETSLSNYQYISQNNFTGVLGGLALAVAAANDPPIQPTLDLYRFARSKGVAVFFITGRPDNIPQVREQTRTNLESAGYHNWAGLSLNPGGLGTVEYKSGQRAAIESRDYRIIANVGDQESDLQGGHADRGFKLPNPFYFIGP
jgi:hypothetical protein